ncbi:hypothetical protein, partial [Phenylobacterium sp.]|uniref:hypothetical protein n=1 Tax=Phenylobacterium sp. TaxID=1871053 RepID=UPI0028120BED
MADPLALTRRSLPLIVLFLVMGASPLFVEPAYIGYIGAYGLFLVLSLQQLVLRTPPSAHRNPLLLGWAVVIGMILLVTLLAKPGLRDLVRDGGAALSFLFGLYVIPRALGPNWERPLFAALSALAMIVAVWTIL